MATILFALSVLMFITTFGIHSLINNRNEIDKPMYLNTPLAFIPVISGFILPVVPLSILFDFHWLAIAIINFAFVYIAGPLITKAYLTRLSTGIIAKDMLYSLGLGILFLTIGLFSLE